MRVVHEEAIGRKEMIMRKALNTLLVLAFLAPVCSVFAQGAPAGRWWRRPRIAQALNPSEVEKRKLDDLFVKSRRKLIRLKNRVEKERFELENLLDEEPLDRAAIMEQFRNLDSARSQLAEEKFRFLLGVREILGSDRFERLKEIYMRIRQRRQKGW